MKNLMNEKVPIDISEREKEFCEIFRMCVVEQFNSLSFNCLHENFWHGQSKIYSLHLILLWFYVQCSLVYKSSHLAYNESVNLEIQSYLYRVWQEKIHQFNHENANQKYFKLAKIIVSLLRDFMRYHREKTGGAYENHFLSEPALWRYLQLTF